MAFHIVMFRWTVIIEARRTCTNCTMGNTTLILCTISCGFTVRMRRNKNMLQYLALFEYSYTHDLPYNQWLK